MKQINYYICVYLMTAAAVLQSFGQQPVFATDFSSIDPVNKPALMTKRAAASFLTGVTNAGNRLVAIGERGVVIYSDDNGKTWEQGSVPVSVTLTSVSFPVPEKGWAVGHSGVVIASEDGGKSWRKILDGRRVVELISQQENENGGQTADEDTLPPPRMGAGDAFLSVYFESQVNGFVLGSFGTILRTQDGGKTWTLWQTQLANPEGKHLYDMKVVGNSLWIAAERGEAFVSPDGGQNFSAVHSPYEGSFFGVAPLEDKKVLLYGLRGNIFCSGDIGATWEKLKVESGGSWTGAAPLKGNGTALVNQTGEVIIVENGGKTVRSLPYGHAPFPLSGIAQAADGNIVVVGFRGVRLIKYN